MSTYGQEDGYASEATDNTTSDDVAESTAANGLGYIFKKLCHRENVEVSNGKPGPASPQSLQGAESPQSPQGTNPSQGKNLLPEPQTEESFFGLEQVVGPQSDGGTESNEESGGEGTLTSKSLKKKRRLMKRPRGNEELKEEGVTKANSTNVTGKVEDSLKLNLFYFLNQVQTLAILVPIGFPGPWSLAFGWISDVLLMDPTSLLVLSNSEISAGNITNATTLYEYDRYDVDVATGLNLACALIGVIVFLFLLHRVHTLLVVSYEDNNLIWQGFRLTIGVACVVVSGLCYAFVPGTTGAIIFGTVLAIYPSYAIVTQVYIWYIQDIEERKEEGRKQDGTESASRKTMLEIWIRELMVMQGLMIFLFPAMFRRMVIFFRDEFPDGAQWIRSGLTMIFVFVLLLIIGITIRNVIPLEETQCKGTVADVYLTGVFQGAARYYMFYLLFEKAVVICVVSLSTSKSTSALVLLAFLLFMFVFVLTSCKKRHKLVERLESARLDIVARVSIMALLLFTMLYDSFLPTEPAVIGFVDVLCFAITGLWMLYAAWTIWLVS